MPVFMKIIGSNGWIKGNVTDKEHKDWIAVDSMCRSFKRAVNIETGAGRDVTTASKLACSAISISKSACPASTPLLQQLFQNKVLEEVRFVVVPDESDDCARKDYEIILKGSVIGLFSDSTSGGASPKESITFYYHEIEIHDYIKDEKNDAAAPMRMGYNVSSNKTM